MSREPKLSAEQAAQAERIIIARMRQGPFTYRQLFTAADAELKIGGVRAGQPSTYRLADRLIQRERQAGRIEQAGRRGDWSPVKPA